MNDKYIDGAKYFGDQQSVMVKRYRSKRMVAILHIYSVFGLLLTVFGFTYFLLLKFDISLTPAESYALLISVSGVFFSVISFMGAVIIKNKNFVFPYKYNFEFIQMHFINEWVKFETIARSLMKSYNNSSDSNFYSMKILLNGLVNLHLITINQANRLGHILTLRNNIVHGTKNIDNSSILEAIDFLDSINKLLEKK